MPAAFLKWFMARFFLFVAAQRHNMGRAASLALLGAIAIRVCIVPELYLNGAFN